LLAGLTAILVLIGQWVGGSMGALVFLVLAVAMNLGTYWFSDKLVIAMTRAKPVDERQAPELYAMVRRLSERADIPMPRLYIVEDPSPNAFATGRNPAHGVVAVNTGLLNILDSPEVEGVVAHELAHIKHRDTLTMAIVASVAGAIMVLASFLRLFAFFGGGDREGGNPLVLIVVSLVAPIAAMIIQLAISRAREYEADRIGAEIAGSPRGLAGALAKLEKGVHALPGHTPPQAAHLCIVNPFGGLGSGLLGLFRTHPPTEERIRRLNAMQG
jgi:heat shock protein HtpX